MKGLNRLSATLALGASLLLGGCIQQEQLSPEAASAEYWPDAAQSASFSFADELRLATAACVLSETKGPQALDQLLGKGFVRYSDIGERGYMKSGRLSDKSLRRKGSVVRVFDKGGFACRINVNRNSGSTAMGFVEIEMVRLGYRPIQLGHVSRFVGNERRFIVSGMTSSMSGWASISIDLVTSDEDRTCRDLSVAPELKEGC